MTRRITDAASVQQFRALASEFRAVVDQRESNSAAGLLRRVEPLLPALIHAAIQLPEITRAGPRESAWDRHDDWQIQFASLGDLLDRYNYFWEVYDPYENSKPINGSLADALASIYVDVSEGLGRWEIAGAAERRSIVWQWRFGFQSVWGHHAIDAMRAIHALRYEHHIEDPEGTWPPEQTARESAGT